MKTGVNAVELIRITKENLETEHICCAISSKKDCQVLSKKAWLRERLDEGLVFLKGNVRGKCFIEYLPAENAWAPVEADGYLYIDCLWVAGQFKGQGYSSQLLQECLRDCREQGKKGLVTLSSKKKLGFLADKKYLEHQQFQLADTAAPYFELLYRPLAPDAQKPCFSACVGQLADMPSGFAVYYTSQCPFPAKYVPLLAAVAARRNVEFHAAQLLTKEQAQRAPCPFTAFSLFYNGEFLTHEIPSEAKFEKLLTEKGL